MNGVDHSPPRERKDRVLNFRVPERVNRALLNYVDPRSGITSSDKAARAILLEALAEREQQRRMESFSVDRIQKFEILTGDARTTLAKLPSEMCRTCITSPPYLRQRDYGHRDQIGQERTPERFISRLADVFDEVHRLLRKDGTLWVNIDDTYSKKQLVGIPWRLAFELQRRCWVWRAEIVWAKASTPEPAKDRPTRAHESVLLFAKNSHYFYDYDALLEPHDNPWAIDCIAKAQALGLSGRPRNDPFFSKEKRRQNGTRGITRAEYGALMNPRGKNKRDVWAINAERFTGAYLAVMPVGLAETCILAGSEKGDVVLDPFCGSGTTGVAALNNGRRFLGVELVAKFVQLATDRLNGIAEGRPSADPSASGGPSAMNPERIPVAVSARPV
jgi:site-specific DNA-methyltransferase (adenine-specific)